MKNSRGQQLLDTFRVLSEVYFIHTICLFQAREVRSSTLQMVRELELKRRSYGCLKTTVQSWTKWVAKFRRVFRSCETTLWHPSAISQLHPLILQLWNGLWKCIHPVKMLLGCKMALGCEMASKLWIKLQIISKLRNHLQVVKSQIQLAKWTIQTCETHLCKLRYLPPTKLDFFSRYFV